MEAMRTDGAHHSSNRDDDDAESSSSLSSKIPQVLDMVIVVVPVVVMCGCYSLIYLRLRTSDKSLRQLGIAAFNKREREVRETGVVHNEWHCVTVPLLGERLSTAIHCGRLRIAYMFLVSLVNFTNIFWPIL